MEEKVKAEMDRIAQRFAELKVDLDKYPDAFCVFHNKGGYHLQIDLEVFKEAFKRRNNGYAAIAPAKAYLVAPVDFNI